MSDAKIAALEMKIAELEGRIRGINPSVLDNLGMLEAFSAGDCTNTCTGSCTNGCTGGCTGSCIAREPGVLESTPQTKFIEDANEGVKLFRQLRGG